MPRLKRFYSEVKQGIVPQTIWEHDGVGHTQEAKKELLEYVQYEETENVLNTVKPTRLIQRMLRIATEPDNEDIVMDFFSGSASTAHALLKQNHEDTGNRIFIMVQFPETLKKPESRLHTIADIGKERIRRVIARMQAEREGQLDLQERDEPEDLGFKVFKLSRSHYKAWQDFEGDALDRLETLFDRFETPLVDGWTRDGLLTETMLLQGFPLDSDVAALPDFAHNQVTLVASEACDHRLFVCLDDTVHNETIGQLQLQPQDVFVCLDSALTDQTKSRLSDRCNLKII